MYRMFTPLGGVKNIYINGGKTPDFEM